jgi:hypothetical protein
MTEQRNSPPDPDMPVFLTDDIPGSQVNQLFSMLDRLEASIHSHRQDPLLPSNLPLSPNEMLLTVEDFESNTTHMREVVAALSQGAIAQYNRSNVRTSPIRPPRVDPLINVEQSRIVQYLTPSVEDYRNIPFVSDFLAPSLFAVTTRHPAIFNLLEMSPMDFFNYACSYMLKEVTYPVDLIVRRDYPQSVKILSYIETRVNDLNFSLDIESLTQSKIEIIKAFCELAKMRATITRCINLDVFTHGSTTQQIQPDLLYILSRFPVRSVPPFSGTMSTTVLRDSRLDYIFDVNLCLHAYCQIVKRVEYSAKRENLFGMKQALIDFRKTLHAGIFVNDTTTHGFSDYFPGANLLKKLEDLTDKANTIDSTHMINEIVSQIAVQANIGKTSLLSEPCS